MSLVKLLIVLEGCAISSWCTLFFLAFSCPLWGTAKGDNFFTCTSLKKVVT